ncbi:MAG TPA: aminotransferase class IV [Gemmatimonadales bacterium]|jgi:branched-subunit amino acid aminotransferase/4-amino-4-deoxychorismate lyase
MSGLFETIRFREGKALFLSQHIARLRRSCEALARALPEPGLEERVRAHAHGADLIVRVMLDELGERIESRPAPPVEPMRIVFSGTRHEPYPHKVTDRQMFDRARARVVPFRADEALLMAQGGVLAEGCVTSIFFWLGPVLCTPALDIGILPGIGRARVIELAQENKIEVREGRFTRPDIEGLPVFLANAVRGVLETAVHGDWRAVKDDRTSFLTQRFWG